MSINSLLNRRSVPQPTPSLPNGEIPQNVVAPPSFSEGVNPLIPSKEHEQGASQVQPPVVAQAPINPPVNQNIPVPVQTPTQNNNGLNRIPVAPQSTPINPSVPVMEQYLMGLTIKRYPDGRIFPTVDFFQHKGAKNIVPKRKGKAKGKKVEVQKAKKKTLFDVGVVKK